MLNPEEPRVFNIQETVTRYMAARRKAIKHPIRCSYYDMWLLTIKRDADKMIIDARNSLSYKPQYLFRPRIEYILTGLDVVIEDLEWIEAILTSPQAMCPHEVIQVQTMLPYYRSARHSIQYSSP